MGHRYLTFLVLFAACSSPERSARVSTGAASDFETGDRLAREARYDEAIASFEKTRAQYEAAQDWAKVLRAENKIGEAYLDNGLYDRALEHMERVLASGRSRFGEEHLDVAESHHNLALAYWRKGKYGAALEEHKKALATRVALLGEESVEVTRTYHAMGEVYQFQGDIARALEAHEKALAMRLKLLRPNDPAVAESYNSTAGDYWTKGDYDTALEYCHRATAIWLESLGGRHPKTAQGYGNIGILYAMRGDNDQAIEFFEKQLGILLATVGERHPQVANVRMNLGLAYQFKGDNAKAVEYDEEALEGLRAALGPNHVKVANCLINLGTALHRHGDHARGFASHQQALAILIRSVGETHPQVAEAYDEIGVTYRLARRYTEAARSHEKALRIAHTLFGDYSPDLARSHNNLAAVQMEAGELDPALISIARAVEANRSPSGDVLSDEALLVSLGEKAQILVRRFEKSSEVRDLAAAVSTYRDASSLIDRMRNGYKAEGSKLFLSERATSLYDDAIQAARRLASVTKDASADETAFLFAEKSKYGVLLESISDAEAKDFGSVPSSVLKEEKKLRTDLAFFDRTLAAEETKGAQADAAKLAAWKDEKFDLERRYEALLARMEHDYPDYYNLKYRVRTASVQDLQKALGNDSTLVEYFVGRDAIQVFVATPTRFDVRSIPKPASFEWEIDNLRQAIVRRDRVMYTDLAYRLHALLFHPVADLLSSGSLVVVPDGVLSRLPFEALLTEPVPAGTDYYELPYFLRTHAVSYAYSGTLLLESQERKRPRARREYLAFAPASGARQNAPPLPASKAEVTRIAELFREHESTWDRLARRGPRVYLDEDAREDLVKGADLEQFRYLHFATHGVADDDHPKLSGLLLAAADPSKEDGVLHLGEIYNLKLNADLVVLSACETGLGRVAKGEGIMGLTRGFLYAGAQNLLVSLWRVSDAPTAEVMVGFYDRMLKGESKAKALQGAKLALIGRNPELAKPYYWSSFALIGR